MSGGHVYRVPQNLVFLQCWLVTIPFYVFFFWFTSWLNHNGYSGRSVVLLVIWVVCVVCGLVMHCVVLNHDATQRNWREWRSSFPVLYAVCRVMSLICPHWYCLTYCGVGKLHAHDYTRVYYAFHSPISVESLFWHLTICSVHVLVVCISTLAVLIDCFTRESFHTVFIFIFAASCCLLAAQALWVLEYSCCRSKVRVQDKNMQTVPFPNIPDTHTEIDQTAIMTVYQYNTQPGQIEHRIGNDTHGLVIYSSVDDKNRYIETLVDNANSLPLFRDKPIDTYTTHDAILDTPQPVATLTAIENNDEIGDSPYSDQKVEVVNNVEIAQSNNVIAIELVNTKDVYEGSNRAVQHTLWPSIKNEDET